MIMFFYVIYVSKPVSLISEKENVHKVQTAQKFDSQNIKQVEPKPQQSVIMKLLEG